MRRSVAWRRVDQPPHHHEENAAVEMRAEKALVSVLLVWLEHLPAQELPARDPPLPRRGPNAAPKWLAGVLRNDDHGLCVVALDVVHNRVRLI